MKSTPGAYGLVLLPYLEGERTPNLPHTAGTLSGLRRESMKPEHLARAAFEGMLCGLADALDVLRGRGVEVRRVFLLGPAAELPAVQAAAPALFGTQVVVPQPADYAAIGAARQAAWALGRLAGHARPRPPPAWQGAAAQVFEPGEELAVGQAVRQQYVAVREQTHPGAFSEPAHASAPAGTRPSRVRGGVRPRAVQPTAISPLFARSWRYRSRECRKMEADHHRSSCRPRETRVLIRLLRTHLRPYRRPIALLVLLQLLQTCATLYLPTLNADIIDNGVVKGDTGYILRSAPS